MNFSLTDWIYLWGGRLYTLPFVAPCLLYRIHDHSSSLLVHHRPGASPDGYSDSSAEPMEFAATECEIDDVYVHFAPSDSISLNDLVSIPPARFKVSKGVPVQQPFGDLSLKIQKWELRGNRMFSIGIPDGLNHQFQIEDTPFKVQGPVPIISLSKYIPNADASFPVWKISIVSIADTTAYHVNCQKDWSATAFLTRDNGWHSTLAMYLTRTIR
jgi:hypothetical protein